MLDALKSRLFSIWRIGKTCLVRRFTQGLFPPGQGATIGVDFMIKTVVVDNEKIKVSTMLPTNIIMSHHSYFAISAANLGYRWSGAISINYSKVSQRSLRTGSDKISRVYVEPSLNFTTFSATIGRRTPSF